jgi:hypothetical protein
MGYRVVAGILLPHGLGIGAVDPTSYTQYACRQVPWIRCGQNETFYL